VPPAHRSPRFRLKKQVFEGQSLMVQVIKDPIGTKGARLSTQISIAGRLLVFLPQDDHIGVCRKIPTAQRDELRSRMQALAGRRRRRIHLAHQWRGCVGQASWATISLTCARRGPGSRMHRLRLPPQSLLHQDLNLLQRVSACYLVGETTQTIRVDSREPV